MPMSRKTSKLAPLLNRKHIRILGQSWRLQRVSERVLSDGVLGDCDTSKHRLRVLKTLERGAAVEVLIHELIHALMHVSGLWATLAVEKPRLEEEVVSRLAPVVVALLEDNL